MLPETSPELYLDDELSQNVDLCTQKHYQLIHFFTGARVRPLAFPRSVLGLQQYLEAIGIRHFTAVEITKPRYPQHLDEGEAFLDPLCGRVLLPARWAWPRLVAPLVLLELARTTTGPITFRHGYRPPKYNAACGSKAPRSDHVFCCAVDVAFASRDDLFKSLEHVLSPRWRMPEYGLSMGYHSLRGGNLHLGVWAPETERAGRPRIWKYGAD